MLMQRPMIIEANKMNNHLEAILAIREKVLA